MTWGNKAGLEGFGEITFFYTPSTTPEIQLLSLGVWSLVMSVYQTIQRFRKRGVVKNLYACWSLFRFCCALTIDRCKWSKSSGGSRGGSTGVLSPQHPQIQSSIHEVRIKSITKNMTKIFMKIWRFFFRPLPFESPGSAIEKHDRNVWKQEFNIFRVGLCRNVNMVKDDTTIQVHAKPVQISSRPIRATLIITLSSMVNDGTVSGKELVNIHYSIKWVTLNEGKRTYTDTYAKHGGTGLWDFYWADEIREKETIQNGRGCVWGGGEISFFSISCSFSQPPFSS